MSRGCRLFWVKAGKHILVLSISDFDPSRSSTNGKWCNAKGHSPLMLAASMTGHLFSISALCSAPTASGVC
jgi:hypothetical protein